MDLGTGAGPLLVALYQVEPGLGATIGIELSSRAADQARRNLAWAGAPGAVVLGDVRDVPVAPRTVDLVVANPPFYPPDWGRRASDARVAASTHALHGDVADFARAAAHARHPRGRVVFVFDAGHLTAALLAFDAAGLTVRTMRFLDDDRGRPSRVLIAAGGAGAGLGLTRQSWRGPDPALQRRAK